MRLRVSFLGSRSERKWNLLQQGADFELAVSRSNSETTSKSINDVTIYEKVSFLCTEPVQRGVRILGERPVG